MPKQQPPRGWCFLLVNVLPAHPTAVPTKEKHNQGDQPEAARSAEGNVQLVLAGPGLVFKPYQGEVARVVDLHVGPMLVAFRGFAHLQKHEGSMFVRTAYVEGIIETGGLCVLDLSSLSGHSKPCLHVGEIKHRDRNVSRTEHPIALRIGLAENLNDHLPRITLEESMDVRLANNPREVYHLVHCCCKMCFCGRHNQTSMTLFPRSNLSVCPMLSLHHRWRPS